MLCQTREELKAEVARTARLYIEAADLRKDSQGTFDLDLEPARKREQEAHQAYSAARAALERHYREHNCLQDS